MGRKEKQSKADEGNEKDTEAAIDKESAKAGNLPEPTVDDSDEDVAGPMPLKTKKRKVLEFQSLFLDNLPSAMMYEKSYMHVGEVNHVRATKTDFFITSSLDGQLKFWKKKPKEIEFVKRFYAHVGPITDMAVSQDGLWLASVGSKDKNLNIFDVVNFDMINMIRLPDAPSCCEWVHAQGTNRLIVAVGSSEVGVVRLFDGRAAAGPKGAGPSAAVREVDVHRSPVTVMRYHPALHAVWSHGSDGHLELWDVETGRLPAAAGFRFKSDTDLYELAKCKTAAKSLDLSPDGSLFACVCADKQVRVWRCSTGKLFKKFDEGMAAAAAAQVEGPLKLDTLDFGRRMAVEKEVDTAKGADPDRARPNAVFDQSGRLLLYATLAGIKVVNLVENRVVRVIGKPESNERFLGLSLYQGNPTKNLFAADLEADPVLLATSHAKTRFFLFTRREPDQSADGGGRDVYNERPPKDLAMTGMGTTAAAAQLGRGATIHTDVGDIHVRLYPDECPKTVENFCTHARNEYFNGVIFHRIIKSFMVQTGDPLGDGTGGTSIWGREFEDEFHRNLRHDRPFTLSMANAGPNTNGSQFFITTVPTPWLDNKHTVFGRVVKGMDVVANIENVKTSKDDKPVEEIKIINIRISNTAPSAK